MTAKCQALQDLLHSQQPCKDITILKMGKLRLSNVAMVKEQ